MFRTFILILITCCFGYGLYVGFGMLSSSGTFALVLNGVNPYSLDATVMSGYATALASEGKSTPNDKTSLVKHVVDLNGDGRDDVIVTLHSPATCGSAGCITHIYMQNTDRQFTQLAFEYATKQIEVLDTFTNGMKDIRINNDTAHKMAWNGTTYTLEAIRAF